MDKAIYVYNPMAGVHGIARKLDYIIKRFQENNIMIQPFRFNAGGEQLLLEACKNNGYKFMAVSGGDGTINYVANFLLKNRLDIPMGIIPCGTSNDFARCLNIPGSVNMSVETILKGNTFEVDVGLVNEKQYFLSTCAGGIFVDVSFSTQNELKKNLGNLAYYLKALTEVRNIRPFNVKVTTESQVVEESILLFVILNGRHAAGFYNLISEADVSDGFMDIILIKNCSHLDLASIFFNVISRSCLNNRYVLKLKASRCTIESDTKITLSLDGEKGAELPISVRFINKALKVFV